MTEYDEMQDWKGMDGATAYQLISRHADGWEDIDSMMTLDELIDTAESCDGELEVACAKSLPPRKIKVWRDDDDGERHWEWVK